jgi:hypothetical protein
MPESSISPEFQRATQGIVDILINVLADMDVEHSSNKRPAGQFMISGSSARAIEGALREHSTVSKMNEAYESIDAPLTLAAFAVYDSSLRIFDQVCSSGVDFDDDAEVLLKMSMRDQEDVLDAMENWITTNPLKSRQLRAKG